MHYLCLFRCEAINRHVDSCTLAASDSKSKCEAKLLAFPPHATLRTLVIQMRDLGGLLEALLCSSPVRARLHSVTNLTVQVNVFKHACTLWPTSLWWCGTSEDGASLCSCDDHPLVRPSRAPKFLQKHLVGQPHAAAARQACRRYRSMWCPASQYYFHDICSPKQAHPSTHPTLSFNSPFPFRSGPP